MTIRADYVVVGSGITGACIARQLADAGREVVVLERRAGVAGNVADSVHAPSGIRYGIHGVHYFRTSSDRIWDYATRFGEFFPYEARVLSYIDGEYVPWPPQRSYIERIAGKDWKPSSIGTPITFEEAALQMMPPAVYYRMVKPYTLKQWGKSPSLLCASLCKRFDIRDGDTRLTPNAKYQGIPRDGYTAWVQKMLEGVPVHLNFDYCQRRDEVQARRRLIFTGPIDEYFSFRLGRLGYRSQMREHTLYYDGPVTKNRLPAAQVNNPQHEHGPHIRSIEWRQMMPPEVETHGTIVTTETPYTPDDTDCYEYPMPTAENSRLYEEYRELAKQEPGVVFGGRLGRYQYLDLDASLASALKIADKMLGRRSCHEENSYAI